MSVAGNSGGALNATVGQFLEIIKNAKLLSANDLAEVMARWPAARHGEDAGALAKELVQLNKLTRFQAAAAYQCKPRGLNIGQYIILDRLGAGGMGTVFKGQHREQGTIVAIKVLASSAVRSADSVERFQREAQTAARLNHPGIVRALEIGHGDGQHYYVMEYVEGTDLSAYIKKQGPLPLDQAVQVVAQAARALAHAHEHGVIHRDIKPGNLIYTKAGQIKILDMGLARLNDPASLATAQAAEGLTQTGQVMGTVDYMAPEQAVNTRLADARADIYSLGCTFYRLVTGKIPFDGESMVEKILAHREQPIPSLGSPTTPVPPAVDQVLRTMLAKKPGERYQTMTDLANDLDQCLSGELASGLIAARPLTLAAIEDDSSSSVTFNLGGTPVSGSITQRPRRRSGLLVAATAAAVVILIGAGAIYVTRMNQPDTTVAENSTESDGNEADKTEPATKGVNPQSLVELVGKTSPAMKESATKLANDPPTTGANTSPTPDPAATNTTQTTPMPVQLTPPTMPVSSGSPPSPAPVPSNTTPSNPPVTSPLVIPGASPATTSPPATTPSTITPATPVTPPPATTPPVTVPVEAMIPTEVADTRVETPDQAAVDAALKLIRNDVFKDEYAKAKKPDERVALARKLYEQATKTKSADAEQFAMLCEARDLASDGGDLTVVQSATALAAANFKLEPLGWLVTGIETAQKKTLTLPVNKVLAVGLLPKVDEAVREGQFAAADRLMKATLASARKASDPAGLKVAVERGRVLDEEKKQWEIVEKARKALADKPDDTAANLALGRYYLFTEGDWEKGPSHLLKGSDAALKELAEQSMKVPTTNDGKLALGDLWWAKAEKATGPAKKEFQFGALYWYEQSLAGLDGLNKAKIDKRVNDAKAAIAGMGTGGSSGSKGKAVYVRVPVSPKSSIAMRLIPAGTFLMGSPETELGRAQEEVQHRVTISKQFFMGVTELTQEQYRGVMGSSGRTYDENPDFPAHSMYRSMIESFLQTINAGPHAAYLRFRLPTEAEWEYAARAGTSTAFYWGDNGPVYRDYAVTGGFATVAGLKPNAWGLFDMCGNAAEYCHDYYSSAAYTTAAMIDPQGPASSDSSPARYVIRGGAHMHASNQMRSAARRSQYGSTMYTETGLRVVCDVVGKIPSELFIKDPAPYLRVGATALAINTPAVPVQPAKTTPKNTGSKPGPMAVPSAQVYQQLCEWAWQRNGAVLLRGTGTSFRYCYRAADLPASYDIFGVYLVNSSNRVSDTDAQFISGMPWLTEVHLYADNLTNAGASAIAAMPNLEVLSLSNARQVSEAGIAPLAGSTRLVRGLFFNSPGCGKAIRTLANCRSLLSLNLDSTGVDDNDCVVLSNFSKLNFLSLESTRITDKTLACVRAMPLLGSLRVGNTAITDVGLSHLQGHGEIDYLNLTGTSVTSAGVMQLVNCRELNSIDLGRTRVTDAACDALTRLPTLSSVYVADTPITDVGVTKLATINGLRFLDVSGCNVTDGCAQALARAAQLRTLRVGRTRMSPTAINGIKSALPNVTISQN